jgi:DNA-binding response OmpR family regulator
MKPTRNPEVTVRIHESDLRALVVDDSDLVRTLVARVLGSAGYQVDTSDSIAAALTLAAKAAASAESNGYDVAVVDVNLAGERGSDLVVQLRARGDDLHTRCLLLTGGTTENLPPGVAVLFKPFLAEELVEAVRPFSAVRRQPGQAEP